MKSDQQRSPTLCWTNIDWKRPVRKIAKEKGCSPQRVYQVIRSLGIKRPALTPSDRLLRMNTGNYTLPQLSERLKCSEQHIATLLKQMNKGCRIPPANANIWKERRPFIDWLVNTRRYPSKVACDIASRCFRMQTSYGIQLRSLFLKGNGYTKVLQLISDTPEKLLSAGAKASALGAYRLALQRYFQFLAAQKDGLPFKNGQEL